MVFPIDQNIRLIEDQDDHVRVLDTVDWRVTLTDLVGADGQPIDLTGATLYMQIRPANLPGLLVDDLSSGGGITVTAGPTVTITSLVGDRTWEARETTTLIGDLLMERISGNNTTTTFLRRIYFLVDRSATRH